MKQDSDATTVPACFISNHEGFLGSIKNFIKDFVVTEIDTSGQRVNTSTHTPDSASSDENNETGAECKWNNHSSQDNDVAADCGLDVTIPSPGSFDLSVILGQSVSEELEQFVLTLKEKPTKQELSLGSFTDKHHRANVHRAVRHRFPFLMTVTIQPEIRVREDPDYRELSQLVTEDEAEDFFRFIDAKVRGSSYTFGPDDDKDHRTVVHHFLSRRFGKLVETKSFTDQGTTAISVRLREQGRPKKRSAEERKEEEVYTGFTLRKENLETLEAISYMAASLGVLPSDFTYAGIKDKRAITFQSMVVKKVSTQRLKEKTAEFERRGMCVTQIRSVSEPLRLGRLQGNHFDLVVRDLRPHGDTHSSAADTHTRLAALVKEAVENVKARGFVNYYGPQRFGSVKSVQSDRVGLALLKEDMVSAVRLFFTPEDLSDPVNNAKRHFIQTDNAKESLALMPLSKARERLMLRAMNRYGTGPDGCTQGWLSLPHSMRVFYPHAYCSRVWNEAVAHRLSTLGHRARRGDLVWLQEDSAESSLPQIHVVTDQEEQEEVYTLGHVLMPMPGNTVKYPENAMGAWYQERLSRDGLDGCRFRVSNLKLNLPGCHRPLLASPRNLSYQLQRAGCGEVGEEESTGNSSRNSDRQLNGTTAEGKLTLTLNFDLDSSCYATICLREIMKCDP
ncbi:pseudouridylate synthase PUS7L [Pseudochaenichthys georgianus]|uniref:pseudouridylate synthase PUS7L n=1 Tax=Pseudochaenichthys georgianus TaxID=52239 RepID=UPI00146A61BE|nr:pseudouridylate synthase 7 homolog-like protein [Pseudochaenichthys georgianus]XP_033931200.1 pseudouridylate synthase 7 homolog-like protein [Pseudochaenichthys georgianus]XP_033931201.1 pseudouridylate synthase 7 homolog-like protein [Pseudochaenichthys georgianus]